MKAVYTVGLRRATDGAQDAHGNAVTSWADPVDLPVYAIVPRTSEEPAPDRPEVVVGKTLLAPTGTVVGPLDVVVIDGEDYEVVGEIADWTRGPFGFAPGVSVNLKRVEG